MSLNFPTAQEEFDRAVAASKKNFTYEQAKGGHYRLLCDDEIILDDSACEDMYDLDSALYTFTGYIFENYTELQWNGITWK